MNNTRSIICISIVAIFVVILLITTSVISRKSIEKKHLEYEVDQVARLILLQDCIEISFDKDRKQISFYNINGNEETISISEMFNSRVKRIYQKNGMLFFALSVAMDDEYGLVYTRDSNLNMDGLWSVERTDKNLYYYKTYEG